MFDPHSLRGVYANAAALNLWGAASLEELLGRDFSALSPAAKARTSRLAQATAEGQDVTERWTFYPNGQPVTVQATISTYRLKDGTPVLLFEASFVEIEAEERRAVEALRHTSTMITLFDERGQAVFSNPAAFVGYGLEAPTFDERFPHGLQSKDMLARALTGEPVVEVRAVRTQQGERWRHLDVRKVIDPVTGGPGVLLNEIDVTARVRAEQGRVAAEQKAAMSEARQRFLSEMSHELRTPLNSVIGFAELLRGSALADDQLDHASRIHACGLRLHDVIEEMIRVSQSGEKPNEDHTEVAPPQGPDRVDEPFAAPAARELRVLYVDDNANNRALVTAILSAQGIECQTAEDGFQGAKAAEMGSWDVILMDIQMPVMDGVEATRMIRASPAPARLAPILAVTANTLPNQLEGYFKAGMNDCIAKPINIAELISSVTYWSEGLDETEPQTSRLNIQG